MGHNYFFQIVGPPELRSNSCRFPRLKLASVCAQSMPRSRSFTVADGDCDFLSTRRSTHPTRRTGATPKKFPKNWGGERSTCSRCTWSPEDGSRCGKCKMYSGATLSEKLPPKKRVRMWRGLAMKPTLLDRWVLLRKIGPVAATASTADANVAQTATGRSQCQAASAAGAARRSQAECWYWTWYLLETGPSWKRVPFEKMERV